MVEAEGQRVGVGQGLPLGPLKTVAAALLLIKLALIVFPAPFMDEAYYWLWSQHPALSYFIFILALFARRRPKAQQFRLFLVNAGAVSGHANLFRHDCLRAARSHADPVLSPASASATMRRRANTFQPKASPASPSSHALSGG
jgi:hypothetical protein